MAPQLFSERRGHLRAADKPNFVQIRRPVTIIPLGAALLTRSSDLPGGCGERSSTRLSAPDRHATAAWVWPRIPSLFGLAPCGVYPAPDFTAGAVRSYRTFSPLPAARISRLLSRRGCWRYLLCGTGRLQALKPESRTLSGTLSCGVRTFLPRNAQSTPAAIVWQPC